MIITKIVLQKNNKDRYSIYIDHIFSFSLDAIDLLKLKLKENDKISDKEISNYKSLYEYTSAKNKALWFLTSRMRTSKEIINKLNHLGFSDETIEKLINYLIDLKYIDDGAYADAYISEILKFKPQGKKLIMANLKAKGIDDELISQKLSDINNETEEELAKKLLEKRYKNINNLDKKEINKAYLFLARKGFSTDQIMKILREFIN